ncbi:MAG: DUF4058 family protein [Planctomycetes bacterium]|nr:DUF4058 family protein [Planctomycetota bacterium]
MATRFPGMDPFIEGQAWEDFHHHFITEFSKALSLTVRPRYIVRAERRIYVEHLNAEDLDRPVWSDVAVLRPKQQKGPPGPASETAVLPEPVVLTLPMAEERREAFLTIRERATLQVVTVLEVLSPANKRPGSDGKREYLKKRQEVLRSASHLVEVDLLRGGERLPTVEPLPPADHYGFVSREERRPRVEVYRWSVRDRLPRLPVPLCQPDPDAVLDLQAAFETVYDGMGYDYSLDYAAPVLPPLSEPDSRWVQERLSAAS